MPNAMPDPMSSPASTPENPIALRPIGYFQTPHTDEKHMPIQPSGARGVPGAILVLPEYRDGLADLEGFSHLIAIYHLHRVRGHALRVTPFLDTEEHGVFATRSPKRPNALGFSVLAIAGVEGGVVRVENVDMLDGTPVLDIKPYVPDFDVWPAGRIGWFAGRSGRAETHRSDGRFAEPGDKE
jgi:tRNA-Thr(GGU) m(6)t(6)A37 methyltransferase TsaA